MTANEIIAAIAALPPSEQAKIVRFAYRLDAERQLSGSDLILRAKRMAAGNPLETSRMADEIARGFHAGR